VSLIWSSGGAVLATRSGDPVWQAAVPPPLRWWFWALLLLALFFGFRLYRVAGSLEEGGGEVELAMLLPFLIARVLMVDQAGQTPGGFLRLFGAGAVFALASHLCCLVPGFLGFLPLLLFSESSDLRAAAIFATVLGFCGVLLCRLVAWLFELPFESPPLVRAVAGTAYGIASSLVVFSAMRIRAG
jgi:hypothetical protein